MPLAITIIGGGISGLTAALCLARHMDTTGARHRITVLEKSRFASAELSGSAQFLAPNGSAILSRLAPAVDVAGAAGGNPSEGLLVVHGPTAEVRSRARYAALAKTYRYDWLLVHRGDLHRELRRAVEAEASVELVLGAVIQEIDAETGRVVLAGGRVVEADVVIGADGVHSQSRREVVGDEPRLRPWGRRCYRWLVRKEVLVNDPLTKRFVEEDGMFVDITHAEKKICMYPCRNNTMVNLLAFLPDESETVLADWNQAADRDTLMEGCAEFHESARRLLELAGPDLRSWQLFDLDTLPYFTKGRLALIGDAAHPFLPFLGQGGNQAIEDAGCIGLLLDSELSPSNIPAMLKLYEKIRKERVDYVQEQTRINGLPDGKGRPPPAEIVKLMDWCHRFDEWENTEARKLAAAAV